MRILRAGPLTASVFAPFGDVVEASETQMQQQINAGHTVRFHDLANIHCLAKSGSKSNKVAANIFRSVAWDMPVILHQMERHPKSSQLFMPLGVNPYLVVVALAGDFDMDNICAFLATADQGVNYHPGTWHHYSLALGQESDFFVVDYAGLEDNCDVIDLPQPLEIKM